MNKDSATSIIDDCTGFMTPSTSAYEAWEYIQEYIEKMESALQFIIDSGESVSDPTAEVEAAKEALSFRF
jgi:hypothetical protein